MHFKEPPFNGRGEIKTVSVYVRPVPEYEEILKLGVLVPESGKKFKTLTGWFSTLLDELEKAQDEIRELKRELKGRKD